MRILRRRLPGQRDASLQVAAEIDRLRVRELSKDAAGGTLLLDPRRALGAQRAQGRAGPGAGPAAGRRPRRRVTAAAHGCRAESESDQCRR